MTATQPSCFLSPDISVPGQTFRLPLLAIEVRLYRFSALKPFEFRDFLMHIDAHLNHIPVLYRFCP